MFCFIFLLGHKILVTELMARLCNTCGFSTVQWLLEHTSIRIKCTLPVLLNTIYTLI